jgi:DNA methylase
MERSRSRGILRLSERAQTTLIASARDTEPVRGLTHDFYKYPGRFSPSFARAAIETFTKPGDLVLDPHVGGGTTLVEARATGREAVGVDISALAEFVARVKCTVFSEAELETLASWAARVPNAVDVYRPSAPFAEYAELGYYKHLDHPSRWRLRKGIEQALASAIRLGTPRLEAFGRCAVLRTAQWALDGRSKLTGVDEFRDGLRTIAAEMVEGAHELRAAVKASGRYPLTVLNRSAAGLEDDERLDGLRAPRLVVTSPPYPGVHVLYHRWQVDGRKEAPLPFMIANKLDGAGSSYYTMGDRKYPELKTYFENIKATMSSVAALADRRTVIVQMVAFSGPEWQLPRYLKTMEEAGLKELKLPALKRERDGRLWRSVPSRRWYSDQRGETPASQEVVLIHRKADVSPSRLRDHRLSRPRTSPADRASSARA